MTSEDVLGRSKPQKHEIARKKSLLHRRCLSNFQSCRRYVFVTGGIRLSRNWSPPILYINVGQSNI